MRAPLILATAALFAAPAAFAQGYPPSSYGQPRPGGYGGYDRRDPPPPAPAYGATADRAASAPEPDLARQLNLRSDQRAAYRDYQAAFNASQEADDLDPRADVQRLAAMSTPQRLDDAARQMEKERAAFDQVTAATRRFYASLDSVQRRTFDRLTAPSLDDGPDGRPDDGDARPSRPPLVQPRN